MDGALRSAVWQGLNRRPDVARSAPSTFGSIDFYVLFPMPDQATPPNRALELIRSSLGQFPRFLAAYLRQVTTIRDCPGRVEALIFGLASVAAFALLWWLLTRGEGGQRIIDAYTLPSLADTLASFRSLWFDRELSVSAFTSLGRVIGGFIVAAAISIPLGVVAGSYLRVNAILKPLSLFGRNIPIAALIPITLTWFGIDELQKVMFIFLASVAFVLFDTTTAVQSVPDRYLDTAFTLGARGTPAKGARLAGMFAGVYGLAGSLGWFWLNRNSSLTLGGELASAGFWLRFAIAAAAGFALWYPIFSHQVLRKVLLPLALPDIVNSLRLLFGLAFGYIMLAEVINARHGLGAIIIASQRQGPREHIYLCLFIIAILAWGIDRLLLKLQRILFPYLKSADA